MVAISDIVMGSLGEDDRLKDISPWRAGFSREFQERSLCQWISPGLRNLFSSVSICSAVSSCCQDTCQYLVDVVTGSDSISGSATDLPCDHGQVTSGSPFVRWV